MRHAVKGSRLNRNTKARKALFKGLLNSLIMKEEIQTTEGKAKAIQGVFDKLITKAKLGTVHVRRLLSAFLGDSVAVKKLVDDLAPRMDRSSGFSRIAKLGVRRGDNAQMVKMSIVEMKPAEVKTKEVKKAVKAVKPAVKKTK